LLPAGIPSGEAIFAGGDTSRAFHALDTLGLIIFPSGIALGFCRIHPFLFWGNYFASWTQLLVRLLTYF
jgi:hypothetical protein